jgi:DNA-binding transcriptional LysR family regulator
VARKIGWEDQLGRRLKLRDLHVFSTVVQRGSMAKAAAHLGVSQPAVSEVIADLEHALGAPLLDRSPRGVELTTYGRALLKRTHAAFDELKQGIRDIEFLTDPTAGEVTVGCTDSVAAAVLAPVFQQFFQQYPKVVLHLHRLVTATLELPELRERSVDVVLGRVLMPLMQQDDDLNVEILIDDRLVVTAGTQSRWARRRKIDLAELIGEPWILTPANGRAHTLMVEAFRARGLDMPKVCLTTYSLHLRALMVATGPFITALPAFTVRLDASRLALKALPVDLPVRSWPVAIVTLKNRTLSPVAQLFIDHVRDFTTALVAQADTESQSA